MNGRAGITGGPASSISWVWNGGQPAAAPIAGLGSAADGFVVLGAARLYGRIAFPDDPLVVLLDQQGAEEAGDGVTVREDTHDIGATTDFFVEPFLRVIGTDLSANARRGRR